MKDMTSPVTEIFLTTRSSQIIVTKTKNTIEARVVTRTIGILPVSRLYKLEEGQFSTYIVGKPKTDVV